jgi:predicted RNA-binding Zn-ribbon protein involved in translation (DUF1610 family)
MANNNTIILKCDDCEIVFQIYHPSRYKVKFYCPECGDNVAVARYKAERCNEDGKVKNRWSKEELAVLQEVINGKESSYRAAFRIGRSINSVSKKLGRVKSVQKDIKNENDCRS